jgi:hypothetical protein
VQQLAPVALAHGARAVLVSPVWNTEIVTHDDSSLTAVVSYGHADPGWTQQQVQQRSQHVVALVEGLRKHGVDADADLFHMNEDWTRWGPRQVIESTFVLVIASQAWVAAWTGSGHELRNRGLRGEADAVRSIEHKGRSEFQQRCRVILLPGSGEEDIPRGMEGLTRYKLDGFDTDALEPLLRDLTHQPPHVLSALGKVPKFATPTPPPRTAGLTDSEPPALAKTGKGSPGAVVWSAAPAVTLARSDTWARRFKDSISKVVVHLVPATQKPVSQRLMGGIGEVIASAMRDRLTPYAQLRPTATDDDIVMETELVRRSHREVLPSQLLGCRVLHTGQVSSWFSLPTDTMGSVLDQDDLTGSVASALSLGSTVLDALGVAEQDQVVVSAELAETMLLTAGTMSDLGARNSASMRGAMGRPVIMGPDESVDLAALRGASVDQVAATVAGSSWVNGCVDSASQPPCRQVVDSPGIPSRARAGCTALRGRAKPRRAPHHRPTDHCVAGPPPSAHGAGDVEPAESALGHGLGLASHSRRGT